MLRMIYTRFKNSGIVKILVEARIGTEGTIRVAMKGVDLKQGFVKN